VNTPQYKVKYASRDRSNDRSGPKKCPPSVLETPDSRIVRLEFFLLNVLHLDKRIHLTLETTKREEQLVVHGTATTLALALMM
jgi:hypothetical protein